MNKTVRVCADLEEGEREFRSMLNLRLGNKPQEERSTRAVGSFTGATSFCCSLNSRLGEKSRSLMATLPDGNGNINSSMMIAAVSERAWFIFFTLN